MIQSYLRNVYGRFSSAAHKVAKAKMNCPAVVSSTPLPTTRRRTTKNKWKRIIFPPQKNQVPICVNNTLHFSSYKHGIKSHLAMNFQKITKVDQVVCRWNNTTSSLQLTMTKLWPLPTNQCDHWPMLNYVTRQRDDRIARTYFWYRYTYFYILYY